MSKWRRVSKKSSKEASKYVPASGTSVVIEHDHFDPYLNLPDNEMTVLAYMHVLSTIYLISTRETAEARRRASFIWALLRDARVFHLESSTFIDIHNETDIWVTESAGYEWVNPKHHRDIPPEEVDAVAAFVQNEGRKVPFPDKLPFPRMFFGYGPGLAVSASVLRLKAPSHLRDKIMEGFLVGHLVTDDGWVFGFYRALTLEGQGIFIDDLRTSSGWVHSSYNLDPWILTQLINIINEHRTFLLETPMQTGLRRRYKDGRKQMGLKQDHWAYVPPPYYKLSLKSQLIRERVRKNLGHPRVPPAYRTDVRAHERCRVMRGKLPLDPILREKLGQRGYKIFTINPLDEETLRRLQQRGHAFKRSDEWLAILTTWIDNHYTNNDPKLPYVPACRHLPANTRTRKRPISNAAVHDPASM